MVQYTAFPGRGGTPLQPQEFYVQTYVAVFAPFKQTDWPLPGRYQPIDQFLSFNFVGSPWQPDKTKIFRGHLKSLPDQPPPPNAFQPWIWSLNLPLYYQSTSRNLNLPGVISDELAPAYSLPYRVEQTWTWSYNKNLIGKDRLPTGEQATDLSPRPAQRLSDYTWIGIPPPTVVVPPTNVIFRGVWKSLPDQPSRLLQPSAFQSFNVLQPTVVTFIIRQSDWPLPFAPRQPAQSWTWQYNLNLIGKDQLPTGTQRYDLSPIWPLYINHLRTWSWQYNLNLIGKDRFPAGEQVYDRLTLPILPAQTWLDLPKYSLIAKPFLQSDWPTPPQPYRLEQTWVRGYNLNLIGQDQLPIRQQDWPLPQVARQPAQTWTDPSKIWLTAPVLNITISQYWDRPQLAVPPAQTWAASYNLNLIGQDRLPVGEAVSDLPPRDFARLFQTWINSVNLALVVTPAVLDILKQQRDWPVPRGVEPDYRRSWEWQYNKNLIGQDQLPIRQRDWPLPIAAQQPVQTWIDQTKILLAQPAGPLGVLANQFDWPLPQQQPRQVQTWTNTIGALILGAKPFTQTDWPNPTQPAPELSLRSFTGRYNLNLIGQDRLPNRQQDWPLSSAHALSQIPLQIMVAGKPFFLVPPQPLPPGVQFHGILYDRFIDPRGASADITNPAWRWPQITPPAVSGVIPLRTLMGTGV